MARKGDIPKKKGKRAAPFHNPFAGLKQMKNELMKNSASMPVNERDIKPAPSKNKSKSAGDDEFFERAMSDVAPLRDRGKKVKRGRTVNYEPGRRRELADAETLAELKALVRGDAEFDISPSDEYIEIRARDLNLKIFEKLKKGEYSRQAWLDLHGRTRGEARDEVERFLMESRLKGFRCVGIIPGRGQHSEGGVAVLKPLLVRWLQRGRLRQITLGVVSALKNDGGLGAVYVLLRRR
ncbi:MAG: hypothetical protein Kow0090_16960 [Myxococcota bacterium]